MYSPKPNASHGTEPALAQPDSRLSPLPENWFTPNSDLPPWPKSPLPPKPPLLQLSQSPQVPASQFPPLPTSPLNHWTCCTPSGCPSMWVSILFAMFCPATGRVHMLMAANAENNNFFRIFTWGIFFMSGCLMLRLGSKAAGMTSQSSRYQNQFFKLLKRSANVFLAEPSLSSSPATGTSRPAGTTAPEIVDRES